MFEHVEPFGGDPILSLNEDFQKDPRPGQDQPVDRHLLRRRRPHPGARFGAPRRAAGGRARRAPSRTCRSKARPTFAPPCRRSCSAPTTRRSPRGRVATIQSVGSSGGLKVGADFIARWLPGQRASGSATRAGRTTARCSRAPASRSTTTRTTTPRPAASAFDAMCEALRRAAGEERRPAARVLPQPDRRRPDARRSGTRSCRSWSSASWCRTSTSPTRASATASSRTPTRCARWPRARRRGRPLASSSPTRSRRA